MSSAGLCVATGGGCRWRGVGDAESLRITGAGEGQRLASQSSSPGFWFHSARSAVTMSA